METAQSSALKELVNRQMLLEEQQEYQATLEQEEIYANLNEFGRGTNRKLVQADIVQWYEPFRKALENEIRSILEGTVSVNQTVKILLIVINLHLSLSIAVRTSPFVASSRQACRLNVRCHSSRYFEAWKFGSRDSFSNDGNRVSD
jgi:hypothetical protein